MVGIVSFGAYIPWYRISRKLLAQAWGWLSPPGVPGEKAVANYDEDSVTMAVSAGVDCITGIDREAIDGVYLATTSPPFKERENAEIVATALDLRPEIHTADFASTMKAGTAALISAYNAVKAGTARNVLVCAADCRLGKAGSPYEAQFGDAAAAALVGEKDVAAEIKAFHTISHDFPDFWRTYWDDYERSWEDRFIREEAYAKFVPEAMSAALKKAGLEPKDIAKVCYPALFAREYMAIARRMGFEPNQLQPHMLDTVGNAGAAWPLLILVAALEEAKPGDRILMASYGNGSDAFVFEVTDAVTDVQSRIKGVKKHLESKKELTNYEKYLVFRELTPVEYGIRAQDTGITPLTEQWRKRRALFALVGTRCKRCGLPQFPPQRICVNPECNVWDEMEPYRFSDKKGVIFSFTEDHLAFHRVPPAIYGIIDFEGGGRWIFDFADVEPGMCKVGMTVVMTFRRKMVDKERGVITYFWKATPRLAE